MLFIGLVSSIALAVPQQLSQQGRLLDTNGAAIDGTEVLTFRIFDAQSGGSNLWDEMLFVDFSNGYYSVVLGADSSNPLEDSVLTQGPIFLELEVNNNGPLSPRQPFQSAPYARRAITTQHVDGGTVNSTEISINGSLVIDSNGSWVGPTINMTWSDLQNIPTDLADGDDDTLAGLACSAGQIAGWNGASWICTDDNGLTEAEVEAYVTNAPIDLATGSMVGSDAIVTTATDQDTLRDLSCQSGDVPKWDSVLGAWGCDIDNDTSDWNAMANIPSGFADGIDDDTNTQLSETEVENYIENGSINLGVGSTLNGQTLMTHATCNNGEFLTYNNGVWECSSLTNVLDADGDGSLAWDDCDDTDATIGSSTNDKDCDGQPASIDCDDFDPNSETTLTDGDCDGVLTADDCDDSTSNLLAQANDQDCDGYATADDCNDQDPFSTFLSQDLDCDGIITSLDCDDTDATAGSSANDADCDGSITADDCNDNDPSVSDCLFEFTSHSFTSCGITGREGPTRGQCRSYYSPAIPWDEDSAFYDMNTQGIQLWTVPETGTYTILAQGAAGSDTDNRGRNYGASMQGEFSFTKGDVLKILVGQVGIGNSSNHDHEQGGGGGSFVVDANNTPLVVAGGGGGTVGYSMNNGVTEGDANTGETADTVSAGSYTGSGGAGGNGGSVSSGNHQGAAGAGFYTDGQNGMGHCSTSYGGQSFLSGGLGGSGSGSCYSPKPHGGFGGGGAGDLASPGGGGGYSGGGAAGHWSTYAQNGGGGGSYNTGANQVNSTMSGSTGYGPTNHDGVVIITKL